jgi:hypothetical protein
MCCFSRPVQSVTGTNIFARAGEAGRQFLVYSMTLRATEELAMILPIPVRPHSGEHAVRFVNLERYGTFFDDLRKGFPEPVAAGRGLPDKALQPMATKTLQVIEVGSFEASFVPTIHDFARLDARFRLPVGIWKQLPPYDTYGFAVFKLKPGSKTIHPMAFTFPRADAARLFFPTVHIHDGKVHTTARFDHALYCQKTASDSFSLAAWEESPLLARQFVATHKSAGIVLPDRHCYRLKIAGPRKNADIWLG